MNVAIVGSREYLNLSFVNEFVFAAADADPAMVVISGGARGVDYEAARAARSAGIPVIEYAADWTKYGKSAGVRRNVDIIAAADLVVAFWDGHSRGTAHSLRLAREAGKPTIVFYAN